MTIMRRMVPMVILSAGMVAPAWGADLGSGLSLGIVTFLDASLAAGDGFQTEEIRAGKLAIIKAKYQLKTGEVIRLTSAGSGHQTVPGSSPGPSALKPKEEAS